MAGFGVSFVPGAAGEEENGAGAGSQEDPYQTAVRILSLRLPRILGGSALAPAPLLNAQGGQGSPFGSQPGQVALPPPMAPQMGGGAPMAPLQQAMMRMGGMQPPTPRIIPGIEPIPGGGPSPMVPDVSRQWQPPTEPPMREVGPVTPRQDWPRGWSMEKMRSQGMFPEY